MTKRKRRRHLTTTPAKRLQALRMFDARSDLATREVARLVGIPPSTADRIRHELGQTSPHQAFGPAQRRS